MVSVSRKHLVLAVVFMIAMIWLVGSTDAYAQSVGMETLDASSEGYAATVGDGKFPWTKILNTLAKELTGPLPMTLGILGLAAAAVAMFTGNGGGGTQKFIMLIFVISTCLFAPTFIKWISNSAGGVSVVDVVESIHKF